jgi:hypothetical protein
LNVPYLLHPGQVNIRDGLAINAGASFLGTPNSAIIVDDQGSLSINGTASDKVVFKGLEDVVGYWNGFAFMTSSNKNTINHMVLSNSGGHDISSYISQKVGIGVSGTLEIKNSEISKSGGYGIYVQREGTLSHSNLTFSNITLDHIKFQE